MNASATSMTSRLLRAALGLLLYVGGAALAQAPWSVDFSRAGPLRVGMTMAQASRAVGERLAPPTLPGADPSGRCFQTELRTHPDVYLMFFDGVLARVDVDRPGPRTTAGITVGDPESAVLRAYGDRVTRERHAYVESGWYLRVLAPDGRHGITFEIDAGKVISFYAGALPAIQWIEGCA